MGGTGEKLSCEGKLEYDVADKRRELTGGV